MPDRPKVITLQNLERFKADYDQKVATEYFTKQEGAELNNKIESAASGSPKGVYATLADLQAAYPTGANGIYVVSADGHWYYWNGSAWADGGVYLSNSYVAGAAIEITNNNVIKATDNFIDKVENLELQVFGSTNLVLNWEQGNFDTNGLSNSGSRIRAFLSAGRYLFTPSNDIYFAIVYYDSDIAGTAFVNFGSFNQPTQITLARDGYVVIMYRNNSAILPSVGISKLQVKCSQGNSIEKEINQIEGDVVNLQKEVFGEFRTELEWEQGSYLSNGFASSNSRIRAELPAGTYTIEPSSDIYYAIFYYDNDTAGTQLVGFGSVVDKRKITLARDGYINIQYRNNAAINPTNSTEISIFTYINEPLSLLPYLMDNRVAETLNKGVEHTFSNLLGRTAYYVGADKTYTTINAALTQWAADSYPPAIIYISNGEYNEVVSLGHGKTISLIGESKEGTIIRTTNGQYVDAPIVVGYGGNTNIENLTVIADHTGDANFSYESDANPSCAYGIHIDGGDAGGKVVVKNCKIVSYQSPALGTGLTPNATLRIEDCECYCYTDLTTNSATKQYRVLNYGCFLCHKSSSSLYPDRDDETLQIVNSKFYAKNTGNVIKLQYGDILTEKMYVLALNNTLASSKVSDRNSLLIADSGLVELDDASQGNTCNKLNKLN